MANKQPLPPPLPPETRTVGQLVAETLRLYGRRFWPSVALGVGPAAVGIAFAELPFDAQLVVIPTLGVLLWAGSYVAAARIATRTQPSRRALAVALAAGVLAFVPFLVPRLFQLAGFALLGLVAFTFVGLAVPVALVEERGLVASLRRGVALARADAVHVLGSLATLVITTFLTGLVLFFLLQGFGEAGIRVGAFLSLLVLSPIFLLGAALLYYDQEARARARRPGPRVAGR